MKTESSSVDSLSKYVLRIYGGLHLESPGNTRTGEAKTPFSEQETFLEGAVEIYNEKRMQKHSAGLRAKAIEFYNLDCYVCGCNFEEKYGEYGAGYIEIHHLKPLAASKGQRETTVKDVRVVCSNCHSVLHHQGRFPMDIEELKAFVRARSLNQADVLP